MNSKTDIGKGLSAPVVLSPLPVRNHLFCHVRKIRIL